MDRLERTSKKSPAPQGVARRRRQRKKRHLSSHLLGDGDRRRIRAAAKSRGQENHPCSQKKAGGSILPGPSPQYLLLIRHKSIPDHGIGADRTGAHVGEPEQPTGAKTNVLGLQEGLREKQVRRRVRLPVRRMMLADPGFLIAAV